MYYCFIYSTNSYPTIPSHNRLSADQAGSTKAKSRLMDSFTTG